MTARRVVTLPPDTQSEDALRFARTAAHRGASFLELRTDLHRERVPVAQLREILPLIVSEREGISLSEGWLRAATWIDKDITCSDVSAINLPSHHATAPLTPDQAVTLWRQTPIHPQASIKHVEPLGSFEDAGRLVETQARLADLFGESRVTVLGMGEGALPFRCVLAERNALDYVALAPSFRAAPGQRLLDDAHRERWAMPNRRRLGILGSRIEGSRSPRIHLQPFDRIDLPPSMSSELKGLLAALHPFYKGFAITSPFKKVAAVVVGADLDAINTLIRRERGWAWANTDVEGARAVLEKLRRPHVICLGDGGVATALRMAAGPLGVTLDVLKRKDVPAVPLRGAYVWTWPKDVVPPEQLRFDGAVVAVVAYGDAARTIRDHIVARGGQPKLWGSHWFIAQARRQRELWES